MTVPLKHNRLSIALRRPSSNAGEVPGTHVQRPHI